MAASARPTLKKARQNNAAMTSQAVLTVFRDCKGALDASWRDEWARAAFVHLNSMHGTPEPTHFQNTRNEGLCSSAIDFMHVDEHLFDRGVDFWVDQPPPLDYYDHEMLYADFDFRPSRVRLAKRVLYRSKSLPKDGIEKFQSILSEHDLEGMQSALEVSQLVLRAAHEAFPVRKPKCPVGNPSEEMRSVLQAVGHLSKLRRWGARILFTPAIRTAFWKNQYWAKWARSYFDIPIWDRAQLGQMMRHCQDELELNLKRRDDLQRASAAALCSARASRTGVHRLSHIYARAAGNGPLRPFSAILNGADRVISRPADFLRETGIQYERQFTALDGLDPDPEVEALTPTLTDAELATPMPRLVGGNLRDELRATRKATARDAFGLTSAIWAAVPDVLIERVAELCEDEMREGGHVLALLILIVTLLDKKKLATVLGLRRPVENGPMLLRGVDRLLLKDLRCTAHLLTAKQFSSVPGRTIHGAARLTRNVLEQALLSGKGCAVCTTDCAKYFVTPDHDIAERFFRGRIPDDFLAAIMASARHREMVVKTIKGLTPPLGASRGFGQGQVLSCLLACLYFDCVNRQLDRGRCRQIAHELLEDADVAELVAECIPFAGPVPVGTVGVTDDFLAFRTTIDALLPAVQRYINEIRARGGDSQIEKFCVVNFLPGGGVGRTLYCIDGAEVRTPCGATVNGEKVSGMIPKHAGFPLCMRGRLPAFSAEVLAEVRASVKRLKGHNCVDGYLSVRELRIIIAGAIQSKYVYTGAVPLLSPNDFRLIDASIAGLIRNKMMVVSHLPDFWFYLPQRFGGHGLLSSADRYYREFLIRYPRSFNDREPSHVVRDSTRALYAESLQQRDLVSPDWDLELLDDKDWEGMIDAEKLHAVARHYGFTPTLVDGSDGSFRALIAAPLPRADSRYQDRRVLTGSDGSAGDGRAAYASAVVLVDQNGYLSEWEPSVVSGRLVGLQDIHRAELFGAILDLLRTFLAAEATHFIDRESAVKAIHRALREPESISKMPESALIFLFVTIATAAPGRHEWKWVRAHTRDSEDIQALRDDPAAWLNRWADEGTELAMDLPDPDSDFYAGELSPDDLILWDVERQCVASSFYSEFKSNAQQLHMEVPEDAVVYPTPPGMHPDSWAFTRDGFLPDVLHKALWRMRISGAATFESLQHIGIGDGHCQLCLDELGSVEHLLLHCPNDRCSEPRDEASLELDDLFSAAIPGALVDLCSDAAALAAVPSTHCIPIGITGVVSKATWSLLYSGVSLDWCATALKGDLDDLLDSELAAFGATAIVRKVQWILARLAKSISVSVSAPIARQWNSGKDINFDRPRR